MTYTTDAAGTQSADPFAGWVILELLGHRRLAGYLTEQQIAGQAFLRLDVPGDTPCPLSKDSHLACDGCTEGFVIEATQYYAPASVYAITPTSAETASRVAVTARPAPVQPWELPAPRPSAADVWGGQEDDDQ